MSEITHQLNAYYGFFYPDDLIDTVLDILGKDNKYKGLANEEVVSINGVKLFASTNSDIDENITVGFIAVDKMIVGGDDFDSPDCAWVDIDPAKMESMESKNAVDVITGLYEYVVREFNKKKLPVDDIYQGWRVISCTWVDSSDDTSSTESMGKNDVKSDRNGKNGDKNGDKNDAKSKQVAKLKSKSEPNMKATVTPVKKAATTKTTKTVVKK